MLSEGEKPGASGIKELSYNFSQFVAGGLDQVAEIQNEEKYIDKKATKRTCDTFSSKKLIKSSEKRGFGKSHYTLKPQQSLETDEEGSIDDSWPAGKSWKGGEGGSE